MLDPATNAALKPYEWLWTTGKFGGAAQIVRDYLELDADDVLPFVFPHGIDADTNAVAEDATAFEPIYLAVREEIGALARPLKPVLYFPHPWLLLPLPEVLPIGEGTLFVGPPSGPGNNSNLYDAIRSLDLPKPWGISLKYRGLDKGDFTWWQDRGFRTHTAGLVSSPDFYRIQRETLLRYETVALPYLSSIAVLASNLRRKVVGIPDVEMSVVTGPDYDSIYINHDRRDLVSRTWGTLLGSDRDAAYQLSLDLMGAKFLAPPSTLRAQIQSSIATIREPVYLHGVRSAWMRRAITAMLSRGIPVHKFLPNPLTAAMRKMTYALNINRIGIMIGSEFSHFGLLGGDKKFEFYRARGYHVGRNSGLGDGLKREYVPPASSKVNKGC